MGRSPCCSEEGLKKGAWSALEDKILTDYVQAHGEGRWRSLPIKAGEDIIYVRMYVCMHVYMYVYMHIESYNAFDFMCNLVWFNSFHVSLQESAVMPNGY